MCVCVCVRVWICVCYKFSAGVSAALTLISFSQSPHGCTWGCIVFIAYAFVYVFSTVCGSWLNCCYYSCNSITTPHLCMLFTHSPSITICLPHSFRPPLRCYFLTSHCSFAACSLNNTYFIFCPFPLFFFFFFFLCPSLTPPLSLVFVCLPQLIGTAPLTLLHSN